MIFQRKTENLKDLPLFIRVLQWSSDRGSAGFKMEELKKAVAKDDEEWTWVQRMMLGEIQGDPPLIYHLGSRQKEQGEYIYYITGSGASVLIDYLELKEARESSKEAKYIAIGSLVLATVVGIAQIYVQVCF